jgi:hypothetical protein
MDKQMDLSHQQAFELLQRSIDGPLSAGERAHLEGHLEVCVECQKDASLHRRLKEEALEHIPTALPSGKEIKKTIQETQRRYGRWRMLNRLFISPARAAAWAAVGVTFVLAVILIFGLAPNRNQTGSVAVTRIIKEPMVEVVEVTPVFDAEAEKKAVVAAMDEMCDALAEEDQEKFLSRVHPDWTSFDSYITDQTLSTRSDILNPGWGKMEWNFFDYDVVVTPELAVMKGFVTVKGLPNPEFVVYHTAVFKKEDDEWLMIHGHISQIQ